MPKKPSAIQREIKQSRGFAAPDEEASVALLRTVDVLRSDLERVLGANGITLQQFNVLRILRGAHPEPLPTLEIAERMIERSPGITRLLDRLERAGLVARRRSRDDRRCVLCSITAAGQAALSGSDAPVRTVERGRIGRLSKDELATLLHLLDRVREDVT